MNSNIGERIKEFRKSKGFTVNKLANLSGISQSYLRDIELGNNNNPGLDLLQCLCSALDISLKEFFDDGRESDFNSDPLVQEIYRLSPTQRDKLRIFLKSMHNE